MSPSMLDAFFLHIPFAYVGNFLKHGTPSVQIECSLGEKKLNLPHSITFLVPDEGKPVHLDLQKLFYSTLPLALAIKR
jgi:hypothetical protein